jgi:hypothetical protein
MIAVFAFVLAGCSEQNVTSISMENEPNVTYQCHDDGNGSGKLLSTLTVNVTYFDPYFFTEDGYPGYYIGLPLTCKLTVINNSSFDFKDIIITATHEYYESGTCNRWWYPYPRDVSYEKGDPMPGDSGIEWTTCIASHSQKSFTWTYTAPMETCAGLDQTHVTIKRQCDCDGGSEKVILNSPEAGIFCPPPPSK